MIKDHIPDLDEDRRHAINIRDAKAKLDAAIRDAAAIGLETKLEIVAGFGSERGRDRSTSSPTVRIVSVARMF